MKRLAFIGAGSHSDAVLPMVDLLEYKFIGYFDDKDNKERDGYPVLGKIKDVINFLDKKEVDCVLITIGDNEKRKEIFDMVAEKHYDKLINVISKNAIVLTPESIKGKGIFLGHGSFIGAKVQLNDNCIVNTNAVVEHHTIIGKHCNISPGATINGYCVLGEGNYIGSKSVVIQLIEIPKWTTIGAGGVVVKSLHKSGTYVGVPVKKIK
ncbi:acetyltransferase [Clostridium carnis]